MSRTRKGRAGHLPFPVVPLQSSDDRQSSLLDAVDGVLNKGAVVDGDVVLGLANVDLIYARLSVLLTALGNVVEPERPRGSSRKKQPAARRRRSG